MEGHVQLELQSPLWSAGKLKVEAREQRTAEKLRQKQTPRQSVLLRAAQQTPPDLVPTGPAVLQFKFMEEPVIQFMGMAAGIKQIQVHPVAWRGTGCVIMQILNLSN